MKIKPPSVPSSESILPALEEVAFQGAVGFLPAALFENLNFVLANTQSLLLYSLLFTRSTRAKRAKHRFLRLHEQFEHEGAVLFIISFELIWVCVMCMYESTGWGWWFGSWVGLT